MVMTKYFVKGLLGTWLLTQPSLILVSMGDTATAIVQESILGHQGGGGGSVTLPTVT